MSELVEKVARAMNEGEDGDLSPTDRWLARAAIAAVAEWIEETGYEESQYWSRVLRGRAALRAAAGSAPTPPEVK